MYVWNCCTGDIVQRLQGHVTEVLGLGVDTRDEDAVVSVSEDGALRQWRLRPVEDALNTSSGT